MLLDGALVEGLQTKGVNGRFTDREVLDRLLAGTGLDYRYTAEGTVAIKKQEDSATDATGQPKRKRTEAPTELSEMTVTAKAWSETRYNVPNATTATKADTPIMQTPLAIQVVPQQVFRDQHIIRIDKTLQNVSGVYAAPVGSSGNRPADFLLRGFKVDRYYIDNVCVQSSSDLTPARETVNLEQFEVLKGPSSIRYGRVEPGGTVHMARKQPLSSPFYAVEQQIGSFDFYRTTVDATSPIRPSRPFSIKH